MGPGGSRRLQNVLRPDFVGLGGFDSHALPPARRSNVPLTLMTCRCSFSDARRRCGRAIFAALALALIVSPAVAQRPDSARVGAVPPRPVVDTNRVALVDSGAVAPLTPRRAFLLSLLLPGYSQTILGRPTAAALFVLAEAASAVMIIQSSASLREARRLSRDTLFVGTGGDPEFVPGPMPRSLVRSRQAQVEDWIAVLFANHVFAGADAYVAAHLWDVPIKVGGTANSRSMTIGASVRW